MHRLKTLTVAALVLSAMLSGGLPAQAAPVSQTDLVTSLVHNTDGTFTETIYTPAPGVSPADVARSLKARGVPDVKLTPSTSSTSDNTAAVSACAYGTARTWPTLTTCFARWSYNGWARPQMYFRDRSNALWPVGRAVTKWNETSGIDSHYRDFDAGCPSSTVHCVIVYNAYYGKTGDWKDVAGHTVRYLNAAQTYYTGAYIALNESYGGTEAQRWNTACHEIGHVLGLGHNVSTSSCLYAYRSSVTYPNSHDFTLLEQYY